MRRGETFSEKVYGTVSPMTRYRPGPGRPSKGTRRAVVTRLPECLAQTVADEAMERGISQSEYVAILVGQAHGEKLTLPPRQNTQPKLIGA